MPDRDWHDDHIPRNWRGVARSIDRGDAIERVSDLAMRAMTRSFKEAGGLAEIGHVLACLWAHAQDGNVREAIGGIEAAMPRGNGSEMSEIARMAAFRSVVARDRGRADTSPDREFSKQLAECALENRLHQLMLRGGKRFPTSDDARGGLRNCAGLMAGRVENVVAQLSKDPTAARIRTPNRLVPKQGTKALLHKAVTT